MRTSLNDEYVAHVPPLAAVDATLRLVDARASCLEHVAALVAAFLDGSGRFSLAQAVEKGSARLVRRVATRIDAETQRDAVMRSYVYGDAIERAIRRNSVEILAALHAHHPEPVGTQTLRTSFKHGSLDTIHWVMKRRRDRVCPADGQNACAACVAQHLRLLGPEAAVRVLQFLKDDGHPVGVQLGPEWTRDAAWYAKVPSPGDLIEAINHGELETVRGLVNHHLIRVDSRQLKTALLRAAACRHVAVVEFLLTSEISEPIAREFQWTSVGFTDAKVLQCHDLTLFMATVSFAISAGNLPMLRCLRGQYPLGVSSVSYYYGDASRWTSPHTEDAILLVYEWSTDDDFAWWSSSAIDYAASAGFLRVVKWLHAHHSDTCSVEAMDKSAKNGHFEVLRWLHENRGEGCSFKAVIDAAQSGRLDIVQWLCEKRTQGCTRCAVKHLIDFPAARSQYSATPFDPSTVVSVDVLRWLRAHPPSKPCNRCRGDSSPDQVRSMAINGAAHHGDFPMLEFLYEYFGDESVSDPLTQMAARTASSQSHPRIAQWLSGRRSTSRICVEESIPSHIVSFEAPKRHSPK